VNLFTASNFLEMSKRGMDSDSIMNILKKLKQQETTFICSHCG